MWKNTFVNLLSGQSLLIMCLIVNYVLTYVLYAFGLIIVCFFFFLMWTQIFASKPL